MQKKARAVPFVKLEEDEGEINYELGEDAIKVLYNMNKRKVTELINHQ